MSTLITGGTGFLGSHFARLLVIQKKATDVVLFDQRPDLERIEDIADALTIVEGDILDAHKLMHTLSKFDVDRIVHFAFMSGNNHPEKTVPYVMLTCVGTANVFEAARLNGVTRVVNASTMGVWSPPYDREVTEDEARPSSFYAATKVWTEQLAHMYNTQHGMEILSLRVAATMGRGRLSKGSYATGLMAAQTPHFMAFPELAALGYPVTMPPDDQPMEFSYAPDTAEAFWCALTAQRPSHEVFSLTSGRRRVGDMTKKMRELLPHAQIDVSENALFAGPLMNNKRLVQELGFEPQYTLERALEAYVDEVQRAIRA